MLQPMRRARLTEIAIVLALSLGASAAYSIVSLLAKLTAPQGLAGSKTTLNTSASAVGWVDLSYQLLGVFFGLAPVALALYLLWNTWGRDLWARVGLAFGPRSGAGAGELLRAALRGLLLAAAIGIPGLGLYVGARLLGLSAKVVPTAINEHPWTVAVLLLLAVKAALLEETIVLGYLFDRIAALGVSRRWMIAGSALLRGTYHLYQGIGGFVGNLVMGLVFGWYYERNRGKRATALWPMVVAHFALDAVVFVGYALVDLSHVLP